MVIKSKRLSSLLKRTQAKVNIEFKKPDAVKNKDASSNKPLHIDTTKELPATITELSDGQDINFLGLGLAFKDMSSIILSDENELKGINVCLGLSLVLQTPTGGSHCLFEDKVKLPLERCLSDGLQLVQNMQHSTASTGMSEVTIQSQFSKICRSDFSKTCDKARRDVLSQRDNQETDQHGNQKCNKQDIVFTGPKDKHKGVKGKRHFIHVSVKR